MKIVAVIPARFQSSRFPGKPLVPLLGRPMILHVCHATARAVGAQQTWVATDSDEIAAIVRAAGFQVMMTGADCPTGTDRIADAVAELDAEIVVNVQGDEPMIEPQSILKIIEAKRRLPGAIVNGMTRIGPDEDPHSRNLPKVVVSEDNRLLYMSRALLPAAKDPDIVPAPAWKQVCIYAFEPEQLRRFRAFGRKSFNESYEDIEILRFLDLNVPIHMIELPSNSLAVDVPDDVARVEAALRQGESQNDNWGGNSSHVLEAKLDAGADANAGAHE